MVLISHGSLNFYCTRLLYFNGWHNAIVSKEHSVASFD